VKILLELLKENRFLLKFYETIEKFKLLENVKTVGVGYSGGKDSTSLLMGLHTLRETGKIEVREIIAITIEEGEEEYEREREKKVKQFTEVLGIPLLIKSFKERYGFTLKDMYQRIGETKPLCSYCGVLRRRMLDEVSKENNCDILAVGHNLEDYIETFLMNIVRGEPERNWRAGIKTSKIEGYVPRIKPLVFMKPSEIEIFLEETGNIKYVYEKKCPYRSRSLRYSILNLIKLLERQEKGYMEKTMEKILSIQREQKQHYKLVPCEKCGYLTTKRICKVCEIIEELRG